MRIKTRPSLSLTICVAFGLALGLSGPRAHAQAKPATTVAPRPDILLIVLDDVGFSDLGAFGSEIRTPNIDALAKGGLRYNRFDSKAVCSPSRASLLTGRNSQTIGMADLPASSRDNPDQGKNKGILASNAETLAAALRASGYRTSAIGKWHLSPTYEDGKPGNNASWPLQRGFDHFYGFIEGWTDQYHPDLAQDNALLPVPRDPAYHFSVDAADHTLAALRAGAASGKPSFVYLALGVAHAPIQVPGNYIDRYAGVYEKGWDALRADRLARMKAMGIVPADTALPPINYGDRPWASLSKTEQAVYARFMATYAGFLEHADEQIGRVIADLKARGRFDNTLIVLLSDNGAAGEAGQEGSFEKMYKPNKLSAEQMQARLAELGTDKTQSEYQRPWAMLGVTPFRRYKVWPYLGGVRTPLIVSWPAAIRDRGAVRNQYVDIIDIAPTLVEAGRASFAKEVGGVEQIPVAGRSIGASFASAAAASPRTVQYFELRGNRAITSGNWRAVAMHQPGTSFESDRWELFDTARDFSESTDLAARYPDKLRELQALWWSEARRYSDPPLGEMPKRFQGRDRFGDAFPPDAK